MEVFILQSLFDIKVGQKCRILEIPSQNQLKRRLIDIGLTPESVVSCVGQSPLGDPKAFLINGAIIALRREACENISVLAVIK